MITGLPQQERFSKLPVPIHKVNAKTPEELFEAIPGLRRYFQQPRKIGEKDGIPIYDANYRGAEEADLPKVFKYIVFLYDPETELTQEYPDEIRLRKDAAAKEAGFRRMSQGDWPPHIQDIMDFKEPRVNRWILDYLKVRKNRLWSEIKMLEEELDVLDRSRADALAKGEIVKDGHKISKEKREELDSLYKKFYTGHQDLKEATEKELVVITPENVFSVLEIPEEYWKIRQIKDVPKEARPH